MIKQFAAGAVAVFILQQLALSQDQPQQQKAVTGSWRVEFDTRIGWQRYTFTFDREDETLRGRALVEVNGRTRQVELKECKLEENTISFVELLSFGGNEIRIAYTGKLSDDSIAFTRRVGDFASEEAVAKRYDPSQAPSVDEPSQGEDAPATAESQQPTKLPEQSGPLIQNVYHDAFFVGAAGDLPGRYSDEELNLAKTHFNFLTPENCMKPALVHPQQDEWRFETSDALVEWCVENKLQIHGHTLVWHAQTNDWFWRDGDRDLAIERMKEHIHTLVGRYKGKIHSWDVVNEAIEDRGDAGTENLRNSAWLKTIGPEFITLAFQFAHEADPDAVLYYNDYNIERGDKHASSMLLLKRLIDDGAPIHGVGIQGHWSTNEVPYKAIDKAISDYASLGLKVSITELDVTIRGASGGQFGRRFGRRRFNFTPPSEEDLLRQAEAYGKLFAIFKKHEEEIERVTFWGLHDRRTWRFGQHPLIFDGDLRRKHAYNAITDVAIRSNSAQGEAQQGVSIEGKDKVEPERQPQRADQGFTSLFNGRDLTGWDGKPGCWEVRDGEIWCTGVAKERNWLIWRTDQPGDFVLRLEFRWDKGNSGVQVRSDDQGDWQVFGYQVEVAQQDVMGLWHHSLLPKDHAKKEQRHLMALAGEEVVISESGEKLVKQVADAEKIKAAYSEHEWNTMEIIAQGDTLTQKINGIVFSVLTDHDRDMKRSKGFIAFQDHGKGCKVAFRNIRLKQLP